MATRGWKIVQAHVPMIRFPKGGAVQGRALPKQAATPGPNVGTGAGKSTGPGVIALPAIEDFQLPLKFQRRPINSNEIDYINRGGPE